MQLRLQATGTARPPGRTPCGIWEAVAVGHVHARLLSHHANDRPPDVLCARPVAWAWPHQAARVVGYANPSVAGARLGRDPRSAPSSVSGAIGALDKLASLSLCELETLVKDRKISPAVRFNAIKLSLALAGHVEPRAPEIDEDALGGSLSPRWVLRNSTRSLRASELGGRTMPGR